ncbi:MAG: hypothetical protein K2L12_04695 [Clostridia bacterium]|nr:hypothetical protein [Clostridia bacterium]
MKKDTKAKIFKFLLVGAIVLGIVAFIVNIVLAARSDNNEANIYTAISGWVSGIATIILGVIAVVQNRKYKKENDSFMQRQREENTALIKKQTDCTIFNNIMNQRCNFIETAKQRLYEFVKNYNFRKITLWLAELQVEANNKKLALDDSSCGALINQFFDGLSIEYSDLILFIENDWCKSKEKEKIIDAIKNYVITVVDLRTKDYFQIVNTIKQFNQKCIPLFVELLKAKSSYIISLDVDYNMILTTRTGDIDFIKGHYSYDKEQNNG